MNLRARRLVLVPTIAALAAMTMSAMASGSPIDDKKAEAARLEAQIEANGQKIDALSERYNGARYRLEQAQAASRQAQTRLDAARAQMDDARRRVARRAVALYEGAGSTTPLDALETGDVRTVGARSVYAGVTDDRDRSLVNDLARSREVLDGQQRQYRDTVRQARADEDSIAASRRQIDVANAQQRQLLAGVKGELATLVKQANDRKRAEQEARARALVAGAPGRATGGSRGRSPGGGGPGFSAPDLPAPSAGAAAAIAFAKAQLGKPYVYAAAGPDAYDCSGLTMRAWQAGGVSMPHFSGAQYAMFPHVPLSAMQPGDLVFWGPGGSDHVAMYLGGGMVIYAPQTGDVVKIAPIYGSPIGAARPG